MNAATHFPQHLVLEPPALLAPRPRFDPALFGVGTAVVLWVLLHLAFGLCWLTAGQG